LENRSSELKNSKLRQHKSSSGGKLSKKGRGWPLEMARIFKIAQVLLAIKYKKGSQKNELFIHKTPCMLLSCK